MAILRQILQHKNKKDNKKWDLELSMMIYRKAILEHSNKANIAGVGSSGQEAQEEFVEHTQIYQVHRQGHKNNDSVHLNQSLISHSLGTESQVVDPTEMKR